MELRTNHFHSGLDLRTDGREGLDVKAAADGWVSRIKVSPWGYGKALYIDHPNGYTTVYGHLRKYNGQIAEAVLDEQYKQKRFDVDVYFKPGQIPVQAGQVVALSGNSGGSTAPHLHFEVRRTSDQHALDPERFGVNVPDSVPPTFIGLRIEPLDSNARVSPYPGRARGFAAVGARGIYGLSNGLVPEALGTIGLSVHVIDRYSNSWSTCGIRQLKVTVDGVAIFSARLDEIDFDKQRYANAYMDHALFKGSDMHYNRCYKLPNNELAIYGPEKQAGRISVGAGTVRSVLVEALDAKGNRSTLNFSIHGASLEKASHWSLPAGAGQLLHWDRDNTLTGDGVRFTLPSGSLYDDAWLSMKVLDRGGAFSKVYQVGDPLVPLQRPAELSIQVRGAPIKGRENKLLAVALDERGKPVPVGGSYSNGWVTAKPRSFGSFTVMMDTVPPVIKALNLGPVMTGRDSMKFEVNDDLSGIDQWTAELDGQWILLEYDPKKHQLVHQFDKHSNSAGAHDLKVSVTDERGNAGQFRASFTR